MFWKRTVIILATAGGVLLSGTVAAETVQQTNVTDETEIQIQPLDDANTEGAPRRIKRIAERVKETAKWLERIEIGALIEIEAGHVNLYAGDSESDIVIATFAPYITSDVNEWISLQGSLLYEQDVTDLEVDVATISIAHPETTPVYATIGQAYAPFGHYDTYMISDPLTLEIGQSREVAAQLGVATLGLTAAAYVFNGDIDHDDSKLNDYGVFIGYDQDFDDGAISLGLGYISSLGESDGLQENITRPGRVPGSAFNARLDFRGFHLIGEYVGAHRSFGVEDYAFAGHGARPRAFNLETGYSFNMLGRESVLSVALQETKQAAPIGPPRSRAMVGYSIELMRNTGLLLEYSYDTDYDVIDGGTGQQASRFLGQFAVVF